MKKSFFYPAILFAFILFFNYPNWLFARSSEHDSLIVKKCNDFDLTGDGHSAEWTNTGWLSLTSPGTPDQSYATKLKVLYSPLGIYFLYNCGDKKIVSTMKADNLNLWEEDVVEAFLWPEEDFPVYFEYELSPYNFELPIMVPNNKGVFLGWLPWKYDGERKTRHATSVVKNERNEVTGWIAEFFIPFKLLAPLGKVPPVSGTKWRANMYRIDYDKGSQVPFVWQQVSGTFHEYKKFGIFIFQ